MITENKNTQLAELLFPDFDKSKDRKFWESEKVQNINKRNNTNNEVLRLAPSPTGFLHIGTLYVSLLNKIIRDKNNGTLILRIEDTDTKREKDGSLEAIVNGLQNYNIISDEGFVNVNGEIKQIGNCGPYLQSERGDIYKAFIYDFIERGFAYPCFMTEGELEEMREEQRAMKIRPGCYGLFAKSRDLSIEEIKNKIENGEKWIIRLRSSGDFEKKIDFIDEYMGKLSLSENDEDFVIYKGDGLPTYHLAHLIDDYLMGVTTVIRANEWVSSITKHLELWNKLDVKPPKYCHIMPINIKDGESVRKLSKRKDKESDIQYFIEKGYPKEAIIAYLIRIMCPTFDEYWINKDNYNYISEWRIGKDQNSTLLPRFFNFNEEELKRNSRGALFDWNKLNSLSADIISFTAAEDLVNEYEEWSKIYNQDCHKVFYRIDRNYNKNYLQAILDIEKSDGGGNRKDIRFYNEVKENVFYFYKELFMEDLENIENNKINKLNTDKIHRIYEEIIKNENQDLFPDKVYTKYVEKEYNLDSNVFTSNNRDQVGILELQDWVNKMKTIFEILKSEGLYDKFGEMMGDIRISITNREKTPNLYNIFRVMGREQIIERMVNIKNLIK